MKKVCRRSRLQGGCEGGINKRRSCATREKTLEGRNKGEDDVNSSSTAKTILFWISIVFLGVMLWRLVSANGQAARDDDPSYSEFMSKVDNGDVKEVTMYLSPNSYELQGEYARPANRKFHVTIFKEAA